MTLYFYLIAYHDQGRRRAPSHWAILAADKEGGLAGPKYHAIGSPFHGYYPEVQAFYDLETTGRPYTTHFIANVAEDWLDRLKDIAMSTAPPGRSPNPLDPFAGENCQKWIRDFLTTLINLGAITESAIENMESCPRE